MNRKQLAERLGVEQTTIEQHEVDGKEFVEWSKSKDPEQNSWKYAVSFQIFPFSLNKFIPVNTLVNLEIEFEKHGQNDPLLIHLYAKGIKRATFETLSHASAISTQLTDKAGN